MRDHLAVRVEAFVAAGVAPERVILDPGLGFAKEPAHNWALLAALPAFAALGHRILIGASRKRFLGALLPDGAPVTDRDLPTAVLSALVARDGAWGVRVHDVAATRLALDVAGLLDSGAPPRREAPESGNPRGVGALGVGPRVAGASR